MLCVLARSVGMKLVGILSVTLQFFGTLKAICLNGRAKSELC